MLVDLRVKNFALIDQAEINFRSGLNVLTGETGAGKSIIIGALNILLGARAYTEVIRQGKEKAYIEAVFEPDSINNINKKLEKAGIEGEDGILLLSREVKRNGRNRSRINGQLATVSMIKNITKKLVDIHGQHEHQTLLDTSLHRQLLDQYIGNRISEIKTEVADIYNKLSEINTKLQELQLDESEKARRLDMLNFQIEEIEEANLEEIKEEELRQAYKKLSNMEEIYNKTGKIFNEIQGKNFESSGLLDETGEIMHDLEQIKKFDDDLEKFYTQIKDIYYTLENLSFDLENYNNSLEFNQEKLQQLQQRLDQLNKLKKKYGNSVKEILEYKKKILEEREALKSQERKIKELKQRKDKLETKYYKKAEILSDKRQAYARELEDEIKAEFQDLSMKETYIKIDFSKKEQPSAAGIDAVEFLISTNPGEGLKPLTKIASGGELSRIMLALKTITAEIDMVDTLVFDEVDSGVGGKTAQRMAEKLAAAADKRQVICITHLPQIASIADHNYLIDKETRDERTYTSIKDLEVEEKKEEVARMLAGSKKTETAREHAEEMLTFARDKKQVLRQENSG